MRMKRYARMIYMLSQRRDRQSCSAIRANEAARMAQITQRELSIWGVWRAIHANRAS